MLRYTYRFTAFIAFVLPMACAGQNKNHYKITGAVINSVTGDPIVRAVVRINSSALPQVFTDGVGHFEINDVPEGQTMITAQRPGFLSIETSGHRPQMVTVGPATPTVQIKLIPESTIKGKVTDSEGEPIEGVGVQVLFRQIYNGRKSWLMRGSSQTDENGEYGIEDLSPGQYLLSTSMHVLSPSTAIAENGPVNDTYPPQYFPNAPEQDNAQPINVQAGQTAEADFRLSPVRSYSVSGVVSGPENTGVSCKDASDNPLGWGQVDGHTGKFKLLHVPSGPCTLTFEGQKANDNTYFAEQAITIGSADITGIQAAMQPLPDVPVHFQDSTGAVPVQLQLMSRQKRGGFQQFYSVSQPDQKTAFQGIPPGSYKLIAQSIGDACVSTVSQGGTDLLREDLTVVGGSAQAAPIEVTLRHDCATLNGTVKTNVPGYAGTILIMPGTPGAEPRIAPVMNGNFTVPGLAPGDYTVYAFTDVSGLEYANPEALREFSGGKVTLDPGAKTTVQLELIKRGEEQ